MARRKVSPVMVVGALAVLVAAYTLLSGPPTPPRRAANNRFLGGAASRKGAEDLYRPEDYTASFPPVDLPLRDAFRPGVAKTRTVAKNAQSTPVGVNGIPAGFTGGDPNWIYTGNAEVNGVPNALLENTSTQEGVFLRPGETWKDLSLEAVVGEAIVLLGPRGARRTVHLADPATPEAPVAAAPASPAGTPPGALPAAAPNGRTALAGPIGPGANDAAANPAAPNENRTGRDPNRPRRRQNRKSAGNDAATSASTLPTSQTP